MSSVHETPAGPLDPNPVVTAGWSVADLQKHLGDIPAERIRLSPPPGYATAEDVDLCQVKEGRLCELEFGVLVEKPMGWLESILAILIATKIRNFLERNNLGHVTGESGSLKLFPGIVKIPDVAFIGWSRFPKEKLPRRPIPNLIPDLAVEVLSETNTVAEMQAKLETYFRAGVSMVWYMNPASRTARSWTSLDALTEIPADGSLDGGTVLPGFQLSLAELFATAEQMGPNDENG